MSNLSFQDFWLILLLFLISLKSPHKKGLSHKVCLQNRTFFANRSWCCLKSCTLSSFLLVQIFPRSLLRYTLLEIKDLFCRRCVEKKHLFVQYNCAKVLVCGCCTSRREFKSEKDDGFKRMGFRVNDVESLRCSIENTQATTFTTVVFTCKNAILTKSPSQIFHYFCIFGDTSLKSYSSTKRSISIYEKHKFQDEHSYLHIRFYQYLFVSYICFHGFITLLHIASFPFPSLIMQKTHMLQ